MRIFSRRRAILRIDATEHARITRKHVYFTSAVWALLTTGFFIRVDDSRTISDLLLGFAFFLALIAMVFALVSAIAYFRFWPEHRARTFRPLAVWLLSLAPITAGILIKILFV